MPARCIPERPTQWAHRTEQQVWELLRKQFSSDTVLIHSLRFSAADGDWEADFIALIPGSGFATIEVKGGQLWYEDGQWWQRTRDGDKQKDPVTQVMRAKYLVGRYLKNNAKWSRQRVRSAHFVVFPDMEWSENLQAPNLPREYAITKGDLPGAAGRIWDVFNGYLQDEPKATPSLVDVDLAAEILGGRLDPQADVAMWREVREDHVDRVTADQAKILKAVQSNRRIEVKGGPGSGKTWLALEQARRLCESGERVALVCYSKGLTTWLRRQVQHWSQDAQDRIWIGTFHSLAPLWGEEISPDGDPAYWEETLPQLMLQRARELVDAGRFDSLVVDEAQDFADSWWPPLLASLKDQELGGVFIFGDEHQGVFGRDGAPSIDVFTLTLDENVRNSTQIAEVLRTVGQKRNEVLGGEGPPVEFIQCDPSAVYDLADELAIELLDEGWRPQDIAVLTTLHRHPMHVSRVGMEGRDGFWESFWDADDYFYCTTAGFKGLERPAVVLAVDGFRSGELAVDVLNVGLSRARDRLIICGDFEQLKTAGGKEFGKALKRLQRKD